MAGTRMTCPSRDESRLGAYVMGVRQPPARKLPNLTAARAVRALEVLTFHPASAPGVAATMGIHDRTARRLLQTLEDEGYLQRGHGTYRQRYLYSPTPRLLALAGQLARGCRSSRVASASSVNSTSRPASMRTSSSPATAT
jgi:IclR helix-turn-helix domain